MLEEQFLKFNVKRSLCLKGTTILSAAFAYMKKAIV